MYAAGWVVPHRAATGQGRSSKGSEGQALEIAVTFPGLCAMVPSARRFVRGFLAGTPRADDMEVIASELITNSILQSPAGREGGDFTISLRTGTGWTRIEVSDAGSGQWCLPEDTRLDDEFGRGLVIVAALADKMGHDVTLGGETSWAEITWPSAGQTGSLGDLRREKPRSRVHHPARPRIAATT
jgi:anti-sigma regulatory factor (Ser/Thr protein kinase)